MLLQFASLKFSALSICSYKCVQCWYVTSHASSGDETKHFQNNHIVKYEHWTSANI